MQIKRLLSLVLVLLAGIGLILYGALCHTATVEETKQREISIAVPAPPSFGPPQGFDGPSGFETPPMDSGMPSGNGVPPPEGMGSDDVNPFQTPGAGSSENPFAGPGVPAIPGMKFQKVTEDYVEAIQEPEWKIVHEVTFGGVERLANGHLKRTYTGTPPSLCPS